MRFGTSAPPRLDRWSMLVDPGDGQLLSIDFLWATRRRWRRQPESLASGWWIRHFGPFVLAVKLTG